MQFVWEVKPAAIPTSLKNIMGHRGLLAAISEPREKPCRRRRFFQCNLYGGLYRQQFQRH
jgi:hypothetical protein